MDKLGNYILVDRIEELESEASWKNDYDIFVIGLGIFHNVHEVTYPHVFKKCTAGEYMPCSKVDMLLVTSLEIMMLKGRIRSYEKLEEKLEKVSE